MVEKVTERQIIHKFSADKKIDLGDGRWEINRNPVHMKQVNKKSPLGIVWVNPNQKKIKQLRKPIKIPKLTMPNIIKRWWGKLKNYWIITEEER